MDNTRIYILDEWRRPVPIGVVGELYIGGAGVARGYLNRPELTAGRFIASPFVPGDRLYRTGDLARYLDDGSIEFLGRNDFQVKIRGHRIELGEIEAQLSACEGVREAVVLVREDESGDKRLVAYYTAQQGAQVSAERLKERLTAVLAVYMVPAEYMQLDQLPLTPNGKVDRRALPAPDSQAYAKSQYEEPQTETERTLAGIWQELLSVERIGRQDNFFELGGHSLTAIKSVVRIQKRLSVDIPLQTLFEAPTIAQLAPRMDELRITAPDMKGEVPHAHARAASEFIQEGRL